MAGAVNKVLNIRPVVLPAVLLAVGAILLAVGLLLPDVPEDSSLSWLSPVLMGAGGLCGALGLGGLFSALLVRIFGADAPTKGGKRPWV